jgi:ornithine carbamoyltransferase
MFDLCIGAVKLGIDITVANPVGYQIPVFMHEIIDEAAASAPHGGVLKETTVPEEAVKDADIILTDTWVSMGQESEMEARQKAFQGYTVTEKLAAKGGANKDWKFMHCLPRHPGELTEVDDEVFYSQRRSLVWQEAQNRLWACIAALEGFVVNKGKIE